MWLFEFLNRICDAADRLKEIDGERLLASVCLALLICAGLYMIREMLTLPEE